MWLLTAGLCGSRSRERTALPTRPSQLLATMRNKLQLLACILVAGALGHCRGVTAANGYPPLEASLVEGTIVPAVLKALADSTLPGGPARPLLAGMVRHAFHDCAGERVGALGWGGWVGSRFG